MNFIIPEWSAPKNVQALTTTRTGGFSPPPFDSLNLGIYVNDAIENVLKNRQRLKYATQLPNEPIWLFQEHGNTVINANNATNFHADGAYSNIPNTVCAILTADCLPILLCNTSGTEIAALHGGWRSLSQGIIEKGLQYFDSPPDQIMAWLGPAISEKYFEVGPEVQTLFTQMNPVLKHCFIPGKNDRLFANLPRMATLLLNQSGVTQITHSNLCTYANNNLFYSYRREHITGRMATLIWFE